MTKDRIGKIFLFFWIIIVSVVISFQMAGHLLSMPVPKNLEILVSDLSKSNGSHQFNALHIIFDTCSCTNSLIDTLIERESEGDVREVIFWVGEQKGTLRQDLRKKFEAKGFEIQYFTPRRLKERYQIEVAPVLLVTEGSSVRYIGGYYDRPGSVKSFDQVIINKVKSNQETQQLPIFGCAVSDDLQKIIDPFSILY